MKEFKSPEMTIVTFDSEEVIATSCYEAHTCESCYCSVVQCNSFTNPEGCSPVYFN